MNKLQNFQTILIINPNAGRFQAFEQIKTRFPEEWKILIPKSLNQLQKTLSGLINSKYLNLIIGGGDGSIHFTINFLMQRNSTFFVSNRLGLLPLGTANDYCKTLAVPGELEKAILQLKKGILESSSIKVDLIQLNGRNSSSVYSNNVCTAGFATEITKNISTDSKQLLGHASYVATGIKSLGSQKTFFNGMQFSKNRNFRGEYWNVVFAKGKYAGGGHLVSPKSLLNDGKIHIYIFKSEGLYEKFRDCLRTVNGSHQESDSVEYFSSEFINFDKNLNVSSDGEMIPFPVTGMKILPKAINVIKGSS